MATLDIAGFRGIRGFDNFETGARPESYREGILMNKMASSFAPLTALTNKLRSRELTDKRHHWFTKNIPYQAGAITGVYTDQALSSAYVSGGVKGSVLFIKCAEATAKEFKIGHTAEIEHTAEPLANIGAIVEHVHLNGASSYIKVRLQEADDNSAQDTPIYAAVADRIAVRGSAYGSRSMPPTAINYNSIPADQLLQFFRTKIEVEKQVINTETRTHGKSGRLADERREKLVLHGREIEKEFFDGVMMEENTSEGNVTYTEGVVNTIKRLCPENYFDFRYTAGPGDEFVGCTWEQKGKAFLDYVLEQVSTFGGLGRFCFAGQGALSGLNKAIESSSVYDLQKGATVAGIKITELLNVHMDLSLVKHPELTLDPTKTNRIVGLSLENLEYLYLQNEDTKREDVTPVGSVVMMEEYRTTCGIFMVHPSTHFVIDGVGLDNLLT